MATLVAIGYPDEGTAEQARETVQQLESELIIQADQVAAVSATRRASTTSSGVGNIAEPGGMRVSPRIPEPETRSGPRPAGTRFRTATRTSLAG